MFRYIAIVGLLALCHSTLSQEKGSGDDINAILAECAEKTGVQGENMFVEDAHFKDRDYSGKNGEFHLCVGQKQNMLFADGTLNKDVIIPRIVPALTYKYPKISAIRQCNVKYGKDSPVDNMREAFKCLISWNI